MFDDKLLLKYSLIGQKNKRNFKEDAKNIFDTIAGKKIILILKVLVQLPRYHLADLSKIVEFFSFDVYSILFRVFGLVIIESIWDKFLFFLPFPKYDLNYETTRLEFRE